GMNVDSFSYGHDVALDDPSGLVAVRYSVTRATLGLPGSVIAAQVAGNGAAGDIFGLVIGHTGPYLAVDAVPMGLTPGPGPGQSNIDGLDRAPVQFPVYFCVDAPTAAALGVTTADILVSPLGGPPSVYRTAAQLHLLPTDAIDALAVRAA